MRSAYAGNITIVHRELERTPNLGLRWGKDANAFFGGAAPHQSAEEWTALHAAAFAGHLAAVDTLLAHGADVNATDDHGVSALYLSILRCQDNPEAPAIVKSLLDHGAAVNIHVAAYLDEVGGKTPLHLAVIGQNAAIVQLLLDAGADVSARDDGGRTPRDLALIFPNRQVDMILIGGRSGPKK